MNERPGGEAAYERPLGDAITGNGAFFTREDAVEAAWAVGEPVLDNHHRAPPYRHHSWRPKAVGALIATDGSWHNPIPGKAAT